MATIVLSAVGAAAGASLGGGVLGMSSVVLGRAVGGAVGRALDQRILGGGSQAVEHGRLDRLRLTGASEGAPLGQVYGRMRVAGQVIWASRFSEAATTHNTGGKGMPSGPRVTEYTYFVSMAVALCEGEIARVGRVWADGVELATSELPMRVYTGSATQDPDPRIEAVEGPGQAPAYRGTAYVVFEDLDLTPFGSRVPQFTFEVIRPAQSDVPETDLSRAVHGVALIPGTGEYALATTPVYYDGGPGISRAANLNTPSGQTDFATSLEALTGELPNCGATSLVVSWFGSDLSCGACTVMPKVEQSAEDSPQMPWLVSGQTRAGATEVPRDAQGNPIYGGTPADASVIEAITALTDAGQKVMFYPFLLMDQVDGNTLVDPYSGTQGQPALPWRGRITTALAPGVPGSTDGTAAAEAEVAAFFGTVQPGDFSIADGTVTYSGPAEWSFRRMILHYAHLCAAAGGVDAFCIGSELRGLTQIRGAFGFPAVDHLIQLAADVRAILPGAKISYAADWTEYFGYQPPEGGLLYHLDPLWANPNIDFIGIDNYMPLTDWRGEEGEADEAFGAIYNPDYLSAGIEGGELYDWYYAAPEHRAAQIRTPITDGEGEPWVWRVKDIRNWWANPHHERVGGVRQPTPTAWVPQSKPVWFTELGCAAIDKGTNQPNKFLDPKSSESALPRYSTGRRDDFIQMQYLRVMHGYWSDPANNPVSPVYDGPMIDMTRAHVWAWDARPYPAFPAQSALWSDGDNYARGHWLTGRVSARALSDVVREICTRAGLPGEVIDTSRLYGLVRGYTVSDTDSARAALQPLMLAHGIEAIERDGKLIFRTRDGRPAALLGPDDFALADDLQTSVELSRAPEAEIAGRVQLSFVEADGSFAIRAEEAILPGEASLTTARSELPLALTRAEGRQITERWLNEARIARDAARFALPPSHLALGAGDVVGIDIGQGASLYRIDRVTNAGAQLAEAVRVEPGIYLPSDASEDLPAVAPFVPPVPVLPLFLDLPLMSGDEVPHAPHVLATSQPWPGSVAVYGAPSDAGYMLNRLLSAPATVGVTQTPLDPAEAGLWDRGAPLRVRLITGALSSASAEDVLNGANLAAIGDGTPANWELFQFVSATLVAPDTYELTTRLRGQAGTDALPGDWPAGSYVVLLNGAAQQLDLSLSTRGLARHYRIGPAQRAYSDPSYAHRVEAFDGIGLRPLAPVHLRATRQGNDTALTWTRRSRLDADSWAGLDVPLGEAAESYLVRVIRSGAVLRETTVSTPAWLYTEAQKAADGLTGAFAIDIAQLSETFGPGLFRRIQING